MLRNMIEFCVNNLAEGSHKALETLKKDPNLDIIEYGCLSYCGKCSSSLYALVDGEIVTGETPEDLVENIYIQIENNPIF